MLDAPLRKDIQWISCGNSVIDSVDDCGVALHGPGKGCGEMNRAEWCSDGVNRLGAVLKDQAAILASCAWVLENPGLQNLDGKPITSSVAILLKHSGDELRRMADHLEQRENGSAPVEAESLLA